MLAFHLGDISEFISDVTTFHVGFLMCKSLHLSDFPKEITHGPSKGVYTPYCQIPPFPLSVWHTDCI